MLFYLASFFNDKISTNKGVKSVMIQTRDVFERWKIPFHWIEYNSVRQVYKQMNHFKTKYFVKIYVRVHLRCM